MDTSLEIYLDIWNNGDLEPLDTVTSENFELRINPTFKPMIGRDKLREAISKSHYTFPDFSVEEKEKIILSDTALALTWVIKGTFKNPEDSTDFSRKTEAEGFSIIFFNNGILTGEWIGYSDLTWYKKLGYELVMSKNK